MAAAKPTPLEASDFARRRRLEPAPPIERSEPRPNGAAVTQEVSPWHGPSGWDDERLRGIPVISWRSLSARRDTLPHVAGTERADRALARRRATEWYSNGREQELREAAAAVPKRPHATKLLRQRCEAVVASLSESAEADERLLALSYVVWPGELDPHRELLRGGSDPPLAGEEDLRRFLVECCEPGESTLVHEVARAFERWCFEQVLVPMHSRHASREFGRLGYPWRGIWRTGGHVYVYVGLALRSAILR